MTRAEARALFLAHCDPRDTLARYGEKAAVNAILAASRGETADDHSGDTLDPYYITGTVRMPDPAIWGAEALS